MGGRGAGAPPVQVVAARAPAAAVVLADRDLEVAGVVGAVDPVVGAADRQLPADVRLGLQRLPALLEGERVQGAAGTAREAGAVHEDAGAVDPAGLAVAVLVQHGDAAVGPDPALGVGPLGEVLPQLGGQPRRVAQDALLVVLVRVVGAQRAAAVRLAAALADAVAALAEDAGPAGGQPGEVAAEDLLVVGGVGELDPGTREVERDLVARDLAAQGRHREVDGGGGGHGLRLGLLLGHFCWCHPARVELRGGVRAGWRGRGRCGAGAGWVSGGVKAG